MKFLLFLLVTGVILAAESAVFHHRERPNSGHEGQCYDPEENVYYKIGEQMKWNSDICGRKFCSGNARKNSTYVTIHTCGLIYIEPGCKLDADLGLPYPDCCPRVVCPDNFLEKDKLNQILDF